MKNLILLLITLASLSCKAQSPVYGISERVKLSPNSYNKDIDNDLNKFEGTWVYQNGTTSFTIVFQKLVQYFNGDWYEDKLIGSYKYIENGTELVNYLPSFSTSKFTIDGNTVKVKESLPIICNDCSLNERRIELYFQDTERSYLSSKIIIRYVNDNGVDKIQAHLYGFGPYIPPSDDAPDSIRVPYGDYVLIKQ
ncbi:hypothetical protein D7030_15020 [Flavobacteriaceae bacterium AU392]|nr:hypothetical protein D1817_03470 [Flavobacteriaceae bacterium]RKM81606.1 hypothetical protein D7030_15020 [Flavobacteriaceae bacterium AU392]